MRISDWSSDVCSSDLVDDAVQQRLHALVLERRAEQHRPEGAGNGALADAGLQHVGRRLPTLEVGLPRAGGRLDRQLDEGLPVLPRRPGEVLREHIGEAERRERACRYVKIAWLACL